jgi:hypothetical protein
MARKRKSQTQSVGAQGLDPEIVAILEADAPRMSELSKRHFAEPHISASRHRDARRLELGAYVAGKTRIYLDQRYWIYCRDAHLGKPQQPIHAPIWETLCALVDAGKAICPVAYPVLVETFKQSDPASRAATAAVIDRLARCVAMQPSHELIGCELHHFILKNSKGIDAVHPLAQLAWTYPAWIVGQGVPHFPKLDEAANNALQKCAFDLLAVLPFSALVKAGRGGSFSADFDTDDHYQKLNAGAQAHQHEVTSFDAVFLSEVAGVLDIYDELIPSLWIRLLEKETGKKAEPPTPSEAAESVRLTRNLVHNAYRLKKLKTDLPFVHILAGLHAAVRYRRQPYKSGDHWDFLHAHQALPYCNAFFTEKGLGNLLCVRPLEYDRAYGCRVLWDDKDVLAYLKSL